MEETYLHHNNSLTVSSESSGEVQAVKVGERKFVFEKAFELGNEFKAVVDGESKTFFVARDKNDVVYVFADGRQYVFRPEGETRYGSGGVLTETGDHVSSPMPGTVIKINCIEGDSVAENDTLVVVEAMKMENLLRSPVTGTVTKIHYQEGDLVDAGVPIVEIESK